MSAPHHDPELFDELMREERRRRPGNRYVAGALVFGLLTLVGVLSYRATRTAPGDQLPEGTAHGLDVTAGQCFWSPTGSGEVDVLLTPCADRHTAEAFAVLPLAEGSLSGIDEPYQRTLDRCTAVAHPIPGARVQVMTPNSWTGGKQRAVCYYRFATEMTAPVR
ncbi:hypothetical protein QRX60_24945 [Amycolatopsis mongoliensis]|uniref:Septum formation-related domain-containing protein n=1 Tax=Amycolatopsis mongoliensis TaxID=715475 RepID=A0A9Y2JYB1_9PSEU|nr:hypothetical protein [Amycolatopsis sp. 4-36]WIY06943.1 hypothetical protein QRX60_24945 [Amycolatopsis sp. 4-36]